jgi:cytochrome c-type biogenesis protein
MIELFLPFLAGSLAFLSPCIVPMLTVYFSLITGLTVEELVSDTDTFAIRKNIFSRTLFFIAGYTIIFTLVGAAAGFLGGLLGGKFFYYFNIFGGVSIIILGLGLAGLFKLPASKLLNVGRRRNKEERPLSPLGAFFVGIIYAIACSHCIGSILAAMLIYAGSKGSAGGAVALALFSLGLAIPYLIAALGFSAVVDYLKKIKHRMHLIQIISGVILMLFGILILTGNFGLMSTYVSKLLPYKFPGM